MGSSDDPTEDYTAVAIPGLEHDHPAVVRPGERAPQNAFATGWLDDWEKNHPSFLQVLDELERLRDVAVNFHQDPVFVHYRGDLGRVMTWLTEHARGQSDANEVIARIWKIWHAQ